MGSHPVAQTRLDDQPVGGVPAGEGKWDLSHYLPPQDPTGWKPVPLKKISRITSLGIETRDHSLASL
jgi:hypothetical protein